MIDDVFAAVRDGGKGWIIGRNLGVARI